MKRTPNSRTGDVNAVPTQLQLKELEPNSPESDSAWLTAERHPSFREAQFPLIALAHGVQTPNAVN